MTAAWKEVQSSSSRMRVIHHNWSAVMLANAIKTSNNLPTLSRNQLRNLDHQTAKNLHQQTTKILPGKLWRTLPNLFCFHKSGRLNNNWKFYYFLLSYYYTSINLMRQIPAGISTVHSNAYKHPVESTTTIKLGSANRWHWTIGPPIKLDAQGDGVVSTGISSSWSWTRFSVLSGNEFTWQSNRSTGVAAWRLQLEARQTPRKNTRERERLASNSAKNTKQCSQKDECSATMLSCL